MPFGMTNGVSTLQRIIDNLIEKYKLQKTYVYINNITITGRKKHEHNQNLKALLNAPSCKGFTLNGKKSVYSATKSDLPDCRVSHNTVNPGHTRLQPLINLLVPSTKRNISVA